VSETLLEQIARMDLQMVVELSEHDSDCLSAAGIHVVGDVNKSTLINCDGLSKRRAKEIREAVIFYVERMLRT
jgi:hypothetical protein